MVSQLAEKYDLPLRSSYNSNRGFFIQLPVSDKKPAPAQLAQEFVKVGCYLYCMVVYFYFLINIFILQITKTSRTWSFTTNDMIRLNQHVNQTLKDISMMANVWVVVVQLLQHFCSTVACFGCRICIMPRVAKKIIFPLISDWTCDWSWRMIKMPGVAV